MPGVFISDITYEQAAGVINEETIIMLPIGAGSKEHGNHLPMGTDMHVVNWIAQKIVEQFPVVCLPTLPYSYFPAFVDWKGSISVEADHTMQFISDILLSFARFGVKKFLLLDGGVSTRFPMVILCNTMKQEHGLEVALTNISGLGTEARRAVCQQKAGGHGDESETSCMLHINEALVHMDKATEEYSVTFPGTVVDGVERVRLFSKMTTPTGTHGNSTLATRQKGERILNAMVQDILVFLEAFRELKV